MNFSEFKELISIIELAQRYGYKKNTAWARLKSSAKNPCFENEYGDKIIIMNPHNSSAQLYKAPNQDKWKDLIEFVRERLATDFIGFKNNSYNDLDAINNVLKDHLKLPENIKLQFKDNPNDTINPIFKENEFKQNLFKIVPLNQDYLNDNFISKETINDPIFKGRILSAHNPKFEHGVHVGHYSIANTCFPYFKDLSGKVYGYEQRNNNFKGHGITSQKNAAVWFSNPPDVVKNVILCESAKDALSHYQLFKPENPLYFSYGGNITIDQINVISNIISSLKPDNNQMIRLANDNDLGGASFNLMLISYLKSDANKNNILPVSIGRNAEEEKKYINIHYSYDKFKSNALKISERLRNFNKNCPESDRIFINVNEDLISYTIPLKFEALDFYNKSLIEGLNLTNCMFIQAPKLKDFNEDLHLRKGLPMDNDIINNSAVELPIKKNTVNKINK